MAGFIGGIPAAEMIARMEEWYYGNSRGKPILDNRNQTSEIAVTLVCSLLGKQIIQHSINLYKEVLDIGYYGGNGKAAFVL